MDLIHSGKIQAFQADFQVVYGQKYDHREIDLILQIVFNDIHVFKPLSTVWLLMFALEQLSSDVRERSS